MKKLIVLLLTILSFSVVSKSQSIYGTDSVNCIKNMSLYIEYCKHKNYNEALKYWRKVREICPQAHKSIYIDGAKMYKHFARTEKDSLKAQLFVDTLFAVYNDRIKYYGQKGFVLGRLGSDYMQFRGSELDTSYAILKESIKLQDNGSEAASIVAFMDVSNDLYRANKLEETDVIENYLKAKSIAEYNVGLGGRDKEYYERALQRIEQLGSKYLSCDDLIKVYKNKFEKDTTKIAEIVNDLEKADCTKSKFYFTLLSSLIEKESENYRQLYRYAGLCYQKKEYQKAAQFYNKSIEAYNKGTEINLNQKADILYGLAQSQQSLGKYSDARKTALQAVAANPNNGLPYVLIGDMYASSTNCGSNDFENLAVYWLAVDMYKKAKAIDVSTTGLVSSKIATYSNRFPSKEQAFFNGYQAGQSYTVGCWINETTTVKLK